MVVGNDFRRNLWLRGACLWMVKMIIFRLMRGIIKPMNRTLLKALFASAVMVLAEPSAANTPWPLPEQASGDGQQRVEPPVMSASERLSRVPDLLIHAISLIGVKYKFGGNSAQSGFDCSGFVRHVFAESLALELPRSSYAMGKLGETVEKDALQPGDLVFYNTLRRSFSHVGIYLGEGRFVHAPSRGKRVEIVDMSDTYWKKRYNGARRLVTE